MTKLKHNLEMFIDLTFVYFKESKNEKFMVCSFVVLTLWM